MSEDFIQVAPDTPGGKKLRTLAQTISSDTREAEVIVLATGAANGADTYDARQIRALTSTDIVTSILSDGTHPVQVRNAAPVATDYGLFTRSLLYVDSPPTGLRSAIGQPSATTPGLVVAVRNGDSLVLAGFKINTGTATGINAFDLSVTQPAIGSGSWALAGLPFMAVGNNGAQSFTNWSAFQGDTFGNLYVVPGTPGGLASVWTVSQNLLGANDRPDVTVNASSRLPVNQNLLGATDRPDITVNTSGILPVSMQNTPSVILADPTTPAQKAAVNNQGQQAVNIVLTPWQPPASPVGGFGQSSWKGSW